MLLQVILSIVVLIFPVLVFALPFGPEDLKQTAISSNADCSPSLLNLTSLTQAAYEPGCLSKKPGLNVTVLAEDCSYLLNDVILRLDGVFDRRSFNSRAYMNLDGTWTPSRWAYGECMIRTGSTRRTALDMFTLFEVALTANKILIDCVTSWRGRQGGIMPIGSRGKMLYVDLQTKAEYLSIKDSGGAEGSVSGSNEVSNHALDAKRVVQGSMDLHKRESVSSAALMDLDQATAVSGPLGYLSATVDHEIDCFPPESPLPGSFVKDCEFIINNIIVALKDPLWEQSWGFTDDVDINLSLPENIWVYEGCAIRVQNLDDRQVDRFRPVDVALLAQSIVQKCIVETKNGLGGNADIGHLPTPESFYVVVTGTLKSGHSLKNGTVLSLPSRELRTLDSRASVDPPLEETISITSTAGLQAGERYPVHCFPPGIERFTPAVNEDCVYIIDEILLRLPKLMIEQTFGYTDSADVNLSNEANGRWVFGQCVVFLRNIHTASRDRFRLLDVAYTAQIILKKCVERTKHGLGGHCDIGTIEDNFYVALAGLAEPGLGNSTTLRLASDKKAPSLSGAIPASNSSDVYDGAESSDLDKRSSNIIKLSRALSFRRLLSDE